MTTQTAYPTTTVDKSNPVRGAAGIRYHKPVGDDAMITLELQPGDVFEPVSQPAAKEFAESLISGIDAAQAEMMASTNNNDDALAGGRAHGSAHALSYLLHSASMQETPRDYNFEALGERMMEDRNEGYNLEENAGWNGPGEMTAVQRQGVVTYFRAQAESLFAQAEEPGFASDTSAHFYGRSSAFQDAADSLSEIA